MSLLGNGIEYLEIDDYNDSEGGGVDHRISRLGGGEVVHNMEAEKRIRREIANSNERRRMQSINAGFQSLRTLLPRHEGEKLSKAAILQQTAEYIYQLEQEKTRLLSQNCQLKRLLNQHEGGDIPIKKRKTETIISEAVMSETPEEIPENATPEPVAIISVVDSNSSPNPETADLRLQLERERRLRMLLEDQVRTFESQIYPDSLRDLSHQITLQYENTEVIEQTEGLRDMVALLPEEEPPEEEQMGPLEECILEEAVPRPLSPVNMVMEAPRSPPPPPAPLLEAAIKVEPKVKVEVLGEETGAEASRLYLASTSRQNLETIVEAIRHLEGDHLFAEEQQELPLALTNKPDQRLLRVEMNDFLHFRPQSRPGVIVVKHS